MGLLAADNAQIEIGEQGVKLVEESAFEYDNVVKVINAFKPEIIPSLVCHRGFHSKYDVLSRPLENTIRAFETCWKSGMQNCECDVTNSQDGEVIIQHDNTFERMSGKHDELNTAMIEHLTMDQLAKVNFIDGSKVITLNDALKTLKNYPKGKFVVEIKRTANTEIVTRRVVEIIDELDVWNQVPIIFSFSQDIMYAIRRLVASRKQHQIDSNESTSSSRSLASIEEFVGSDVESDSGIIVAPRVQSGTKFLVLTEVDKHSPVFDQKLKDHSLNFNLADPNVIDILVNRLLRGHGVELDGIYMGYHPTMITDQKVIENLKKMCTRMIVGVFFEKKDPDRYSIVTRLLQLGVNFVNTDLPHYEEFFDESS